MWLPSRTYSEWMSPSRSQIYIAHGQKTQKINVFWIGPTRHLTHLSSTERTTEALSGWATRVTITWSATSAIRSSVVGSYHVGKRWRKTRFLYEIKITSNFVRLRAPLGTDQCILDLGENVQSENAPHCGSVEAGRRSTIRGRRPRLNGHFFISTEMHRLERYSLAKYST